MLCYIVAAFGVAAVEVYIGNEFIAKNKPNPGFDYLFFNEGAAT